jgi:hypothetical protein
MAEAVLASLPQMRGDARLVPCAACALPHPLIYRVGQTPVVECAEADLRPREMRLYLDGTPMIVVGARPALPDPDSTPKKSRRPA